MNCQIHRFRESVAIHLSDSRTVYLTPLEAGKIGRALEEYALDCGVRKFSDSRLATFSIELSQEKGV